jgi:phosphatidylinositol glycan class M
MADSERWLWWGGALRGVALVYGLLQDELGPLPFTDKDYFVFTDAAALVRRGLSPYTQPSYRYPPLVALILAPLPFHAGKLAFLTCDLACGFLQLRLLQYTRHKFCPSCSRRAAEARSQDLHLGQQSCSQRNEPSPLSSSSYSIKLAVSLWLLNPLAAIVSARGNFDSLQGTFVLFALLSLEHSKRNRSCALALASGFSLGIAGHLRLYPCAFGLPLLLAFATTPRRLLDRSALCFLFGALLTFGGLAAMSFANYGNEYIEKSLIHHLRRVDTKHNFSPFFYPQYLQAAVPSCAPTWMLSFSSLLKWILIVLLGAAFGRHDPSFACLMQSLAFVAFNTHFTAQYFVWFLVFAPAVLGQPEWHDGATQRTLALPAAAWVMSMLLWLLQAYRLDEIGESVHLGVWAASECMLLSSAALIGTLAWNWHRKVYPKFAT